MQPLPRSINQSLTTSDDESHAPEARLLEVQHRMAIEEAAAAPSCPAVAAVVHVGRGATNETKTVANVATTLPAEIAKQAAAANVRTAIPSLEAFYADHGTYGGADVSALRRDYDPGIDPSVKLGWIQTGR